MAHRQRHAKVWMVISATAIAITDLLLLSSFSSSFLVFSLALLRLASALGLRVVLPLLMLK